MRGIAVKLLSIVTLGIGCGGLAQATDSLSSSIELQARSVKDATNSQVRIDQTHEKTQTLVSEYSAVTRELESLKRYDAHLERMVQNQENTIAERERQLDDIAVTHREVVPLMSRMVDSLSRFIELDVPFLSAERRRRVESLQELIDSPEATAAEKYRRILEAYRIEVEYGRTVEAYPGSLVTSEGNSTVEFLRVGRIVFIYRTLDGAQAGVWDSSTAAWNELSDEYRGDLAKAFRVARKQAAPDLLKLPVFAPESAL